MANYFQGIQRIDPAVALSSPRDMTALSDGVDETEATGSTAFGATLAGEMASQITLQHLSERIAPLATLGEPARVFLTGCRRGDGTSTIATALALDLSQRLGLRTLLVESPYPRSFNPLLAGRSKDNGALSLESPIALQTTSHPRLDKYHSSIRSGGYPEGKGDEIGNLIKRYQIAIVDLGVIRLNATALELARSKDPILIVARYQQTERYELLSTLYALRTSKRRSGGVILNNYRDPLPPLLRRILGHRT